MARPRCSSATSGSPRKSLIQPLTYRHLIDLYRNPDRTSAEVKALTLRRIAEIDRKMAELAGMRSTLVRLADRCHGDDRPECPILDDLAAPSP